jgi:hypothetical protein
MKIHFDDMTKTEQWIITSINPDLINEICKADVSQGLDIVFTISGIEIPFDKMVARIEEAFDHNVDYKVAEITGIRKEFVDNLEELKNMAFDLSHKLDEIITTQER